MNALSYTLQLNDKMSSVLSKIGVASISATDKIRGIKQETEKLNTISLDGFLSTVKKIVPAIGVGATLGKSIKDGMEQEMRNVSFEVLFGGINSAKQMIDQISNYAAKSPYGKVGLSEATQMMAGFGIAQEKIMPNMKMIGDIAMGDAQKFQSLALVLSQVSSLGYMQGNDKLQFINAGFNPLKELEKMTGKSIGQLETMMSKGQISIGMIEDALKHATSKGGQFYGMIDKINGTASGQWATAMGNMSEKLLGLYNNILQPLILPALQKFNIFLEDPIGAIGRLADKITTNFPIMTTAILATTGAVVGYKLAMFSLAGIHMIIAGMKSALVAYEIVVFAVKNATSLWTATQWLLNVALTANPVGLIVAGVVGLIAAITFLIVKVDGWGETWDNVIKFCSTGFDLFKNNLILKWLTIQDTFLDGLGIIKKGWYELQSLWNSKEANEGLANLESERNARAKAIATQKNKVDGLANTLKNMEVYKLKANNTSFSDVANKLKAKIGISEPNVPGTNMASGTSGGYSTGGVGGGTAGKDTANSIATGGTKTTHVTINVGDMAPNMTINVSDPKNGVYKLRDEILDELTRVLTMAQGQI